MKTLRFSLSALLTLIAAPFVAAVGCDNSSVIPIGSDAQEVSCNADSDCPSGEICSAGICGSDPAACVPAAETCNGVDDDCDGVVDDGATCNNGTVCVNGSCGGSGSGGGSSSSSSSAGGGSPCDPANAPPETCNGVDDDCDGVVDDGSLCGFAEVCLNGQCQVCDPAGNCNPPCASDADCPVGEVCLSGICTSNGCNPQPESCNGVDDDCDGVVDDGATCADGSACVNGACGGGCDPANPGVETCNGVDDNCDGMVDEGSLCGFAEVCLNGLCQICNGGACFVPCASDADCPPAQTCQNGMCI